ncbi:putative MFS multidrug transporter [Cadophora sp. DSE1049]|nr:putative MFS multidrug transporter [Cadophora sp. DSE1049]
MALNTAVQPLRTCQADAGEKTEPAHELSGATITTSEVQTRIPETPSNARLAVILGTCWISSFFTAVDSTVIATLVIPISVTFESLPSLAWLGATYLIGTAVSQPLCGSLSEIFGRRPSFLVANIIFGIGTLICGLAAKEWQLLLGRLIAGLGGGAIYAISTFIGSDLIPLRKRALFAGLGNVSWGVGTGIGGLFGGWIHGLIGWKWAFLIQVPVIAFAAVLNFSFVRIPKRESQKPSLLRVDYLGCFTLASFLVLLLLGLNAGGNIVAWRSPLVYITLPLSTVVLGLFIIVEQRIANEPILPLHLFRNQTVIAVSLTYFLDYVSGYGILFYIPVYLQLVGNSSVAVGERFILHSLGTASAGVGAGLIMKARGKYYWLSITVHLFSMTGYGLLTRLEPSTPSYYSFVVMLIIGFGFGGMLVINLTALTSSVKREEQALGISVSFVFRAVGSTLGVTLASAVFQNVLRQTLETRLGDREDSRRIIALLRSSFAEISKVEPQIRTKVVDSYMTALSAVFWLSFGMSVLAAVSGLFIKEHKLHATLNRS